MALKGTLADMAIIDLIQFPHVGRKTGHLIINGVNGEARLFYESGALVHAVLGDVAGMEALVRVVDWSEGEFEFLVDMAPVAKSIELDLHRAVMQALKIHDELKAEEQRRGNPDSGHGGTDAALVGKLADFIDSNDFAMHACVLNSNGNVMASADGGDGTPEGIEDLRSTLHSLLQDYPRGTLNRVLVEDQLGTVVLVRLREGGGLIVIAGQGASLGAVSMSVGKLAVSLG